MGLHIGRKWMTTSFDKFYGKMLVGICIITSCITLYGNVFYCYGLESMTVGRYFLKDSFNLHLKV